MNGNEILNILIRDLEPDRRVLNPRGPIRDTTDLQAAIRDAGRIHNPIWVRPARDEDGNKIEGKWWIIDGERRWRAARQLGLETIPAIVKDVDDEGARALILAANQSEDLPPIVLDNEGNVIGGLCVLIVDALKIRKNRQKLAAQLGRIDGRKATGDLVSAYVYLYRDVPKVQRKVADGQLPITIYALMKRAPIELRLYVACRKGSIKADWLRKVKKNWAEIERELADWEPESDEEPGPDEVVEPPAPVEDVGDPVPPATFFLGEAKQILADIEGPLAPAGLFIVDQIEAEIERLRETTEWMKQV